MMEAAELEITGAVDALSYRVTRVGFSFNFSDSDSHGIVDFTGEN